MAGNHPPVAGGGQRREQTICDQEEPGTGQIPKRRERQETTVEGRAKRQTKGQLGPYGSGRGPNPTTPHRTSGKTEEGGTMLPLQSTRTHVQGMPQKAQQTSSLHQSAERYDPTSKNHCYRGGNHLPNGDGRGKSQPTGGGTKRAERRRPG